MPCSKSQRSYSIPDRRSRSGSQTQNRTTPSLLVRSYFCFTNVPHTLPLDTYLQTNDQMNSVLTRYEAFKRGETPPASIPEEFLPGKNEPLSLIDFDDATSQPGSGSGAGSSSKPADDLASLFESPASSSYAPATSSSGRGTYPLVPNVNNQQTSAIPPQISSPFPGSTPQFGQIKLPSTPPLQNQLQGSGRVGPPGTISPLAPARASPSSNLAATSIPQQPLVPQATPLPPISQVTTPQGKDPFADLAGLF
jgi:hypothetical protein